MSGDSNNKPVLEELQLKTEITDKQKSLSEYILVIQKKKG